MQKLLKYLAIFLLLATTNIFSQLSRTHYIPPLTHAGTGNANANDQYLYISTPSISEVPVIISPVGGNQIETTVSNANPRVINLNSGYGQLFVQASTTSQVHNDKGFIIEAEDVIYVSVRMIAPASALMRAKALATDSSSE